MVESLAASGVSTANEGLDLLKQCNANVVSGDHNEANHNEANHNEANHNEANHNEANHNEVNHNEAKINAHVLDVHAVGPVLEKLQSAAQESSVAFAELPTSLAPAVRQRSEDEFERVQSQVTIPFCRSPTVGTVNSLP